MGLVLIVVLTVVPSVPAGAVFGFWWAMRRLPRTLGEMSEDELAELAAASVQHRAFPAPLPTPSIDDRVAEALAVHRQSLVEHGSAWLSQ